MHPLLPFRGGPCYQAGRANKCVRDKVSFAIAADNECRASSEGFPNVGGGWVHSNVWCISFFALLHQ